jgi:hypothetical protein
MWWYFKSLVSFVLLRKCNIPSRSVFILPLAQNAAATFSQIIFSLGIGHLWDQVKSTFSSAPIDMQACAVQLSQSIDIRLKMKLQRQRHRYQSKRDIHYDMANKRLGEVLSKSTQYEAEYYCCKTTSFHLVFRAFISPPLIIPFAHWLRLCSNVIRTPKFKSIEILQMYEQM